MTIGAKAVTWDWAYLQSIDDEKQCYQLSNRQVVFLMSVFLQAGWSTRWFNADGNFNDVERFVNDVQFSLLNGFACATGSASTNQITQSALNDLCTQFETVQEDDMSLQIQVINGAPFLVEVCCGGSTNYYALSAATVDANGTPITPDNGSLYGGAFNSNSGEAGSWDGVIDSGNQSCYAQNATAALTQHALDFTFKVTDWLQLGLDAVTPDNKYLLGAQLVGDLLFETPSLLSIAEYSKSLSQSALQSPETQDALVSAWNFTGSVNRDQLRQWIQNAPFFAPTGDVLYPNVAVRSLLDTWSRYARLSGINETLQLVGAECQSGNTIPDWDYDWSYTVNWVSPNNPQGWTNFQNGLLLGDGWHAGTPNIHVISLLYSVAATAAGRLTALYVTFGTPMNGDRNTVGISVEGDVETSAINYALNANEILWIAPVGLSYESGETLGIFAEEYEIGTQMNAVISQATIWGTGVSPF